MNNMPRKPRTSKAEEKQKQKTNNHYSIFISKKLMAVKNKSKHRLNPDPLIKFKVMNTYIHFEIC